MATIEKRIGRNGEETYRVRVRVKGFKTQESTFKRKTDATSWAKKVEVQMREGQFFDLIVGHRQLEAVAETDQRLLVEFLL